MLIMSNVRRAPLLLSILAMWALTACGKMPSPFAMKDRTPRNDVEAPFDPPNTYPGWAYDAPSYVKPAQQLTPEPSARPGDPSHYFTKEKVVMISRPSGYTPEEAPRVAIWWTDNNGFHWHKAGYFGREQSFFPFEVEEDGDYGIRFVGPGQELAMQAVAYPERVYHVDTVIPEVQVTVNPDQTWYNPGQKVTVFWRAEDYHLIETPVRITALVDFTANEQKPIEIQKGLAAEGAITYVLPQEMLDHEVRFRVDAIDRANNLGIAFSHALQVVSEPVEPPAAEPAADAQASGALSGGGASAGPAYPDALPAEGPRDDSFTQAAPPVGAEVILPAGFQPLAAAPAREEPAAPVSFPEPSSTPQPIPYATSIARQPDYDASAEPASPLAAAPVEGTAGVPADVPWADPQAATPNPNACPEEMTPPAPTADSSEGGVPVSSAGSEAESLFFAAGRSAAGNDPTHGNGLLVPLPATVEPKQRHTRWTLAHPWRVLGRLIDSSIRTVWALPRSRFGLEAQKAFEGRFLADNPALRPVQEPGRAESAIVGLPEKAEQDPEGIP
jgi:hypothetical protein